MATQAVRFKEPTTGDPASQQKKVPKESWAEHEVVIRKLHPTMTLMKLMAHMSNEYGFKPTRRQCVSQFQLWELGKYKSKTSTVTVVSSRGHASHNLVLPDPITPTPDTPQQGKRRRAIVSSRSSTDSSLLLTRPPAKKGRHYHLEEPSRATSPIDLEAATVPSGPVSILSQQLEAFEPEGPVETQYVPALLGVNKNGKTTNSERRVDRSGNTALMLTSSKSGQIHSRLGPRSAEIGKMGFENRRPTIITSNHDGEILPPPLSNLGKGPQLPKIPAFVPYRWDSAQELSEICQKLSDGQKQICTDRDYDNIDLAAEYLEASGYEQDAFLLQVLMLKYLRRRSSPATSLRLDLQELLQRIIKCSRCASAPGHFEFIQHHLQEVSDLLQVDAVVENFLVRMALAEISSRRSDRAHTVYKYVLDAREIVQGATDFSATEPRGSRRLISRLPEHDRSLDLTLYHYVQAEEICLSDPKCSPADRRDCWIYRIPGPFGLVQPGPDYSASIGDPARIGEPYARNPCVRSCLSWCYHETTQFHALDVNHPLGDYPTRLYPRSMSQVLFKALWHKADLRMMPVLTEPVNDNDLTIWRTDARSRMGISATELLRITCGYIVNTALVEQLSLEAAAAMLLRASDIKLTSCFLDEFTQCRHRMGDDDWAAAARAGATAVYRPEAPKQTDVRAGRPEAAGRVRERDADTFDSIPEGQAVHLTMGQVLPIMEGSAMASSLGSSDKSLFSMKKVMMRMEEKVRKARGKAPAVSGGSVTGTGSRSSRLSYPTISSLSFAFGRTSISLGSQAEGAIGTTLGQ